MSRNPQDGVVGMPPAMTRLHPDARPQWAPRPVSAGDERNRFGGASAQLHGSIKVAMANKASVLRNVGHVIGASGATVLAASFSGTVSQFLNNNFVD